MEETLKTAGTGFGGFLLSLWNWLPEVIKIRKELKTK